MSVEDNKNTMRRLVEDIFNKRDFSVIPEVISPDFVFVTFFGDFRGHEGFRQMCDAQNAAFPDLHYAIDEMIGEGDKLASRLTWSGTFKGKFGAMEPTGKYLSMSEAVFMTFKDGKAPGPITFMDTLEFFRQAGITQPNAQGRGR